MKHTRKIAAILLLSLVISALSALMLTSAFALSATNIKGGENMQYADYAAMHTVRYDGFETSTTINSKSTLGASGDGRYQNASLIKEDGKGAPYIYDAASPKPTSSKQYYNLDWKVNKDNGGQKHYITARSGVTDLQSALGDPLLTPQNGYVVEFDIATHSSDGTESGAIQLLNAGSAGAGLVDIAHYASTATTSTISSYISPTSGNTAGQYGKGTKTSFSADRGKWIHITIVYDPNDKFNAYNPTDAASKQYGTITIYANNAQVDREGAVSRKCIGRIAAMDTTKSKDAVAEVYPLFLRIGKQDSTKGDICLDNFLWYQGTKVGDPDYVSKLTPADQLINAVNLAKGTSTDYIARYEAYENVRDNMLPLYWDGEKYIGEGATNPSVATAVTDFNTFIKSSSFTSMAAQARVAYSAEYRTMVTNLKNKGRGISNVGDRTIILNNIDAFFEEISSKGMFDITVSNYTTANADYNNYSSYLKIDTNANIFKVRMDRFDAASKLNLSDAMKTHYEVATGVLSDAKAARSAISSSHSDYAGLNTAISTTYAGALAKLQAEERKANSQRFIDIVNLFNGKTDDAIRADADGSIRKQWQLARAALEAGNMDTALTGYSTAKQRYDHVNGIVWDVIQAEHVQILTAKLQVFADSNAPYIDRSGACTFIDNYIAKIKAAKDTDLDSLGNLTNPQLVAIETQNNSNKASLGTLSEEYVALLKANTDKFIADMAEIGKLTKYADIMKNWDSVTNLYFSMNVQGEAAEAAVKRYEEIRARLNAIEVDSTRFIKEMENIASYTKKQKDETYLSFLECYKCEANVDDTFAGVSAHLGKYNQMKTEYLARYEISNTESSEAISAVCASRSFAGIDDLIKYVGQGI